MIDFDLVSMLRSLETFWNWNYAIVWFVAPFMLFSVKADTSVILEIKLFTRRLWLLLLVAPPLLATLLLVLIGVTKEVPLEKLFLKWMPKHLWKIAFFLPFCLLGFGVRYSYGRWFIPWFSANHRKSLITQKTDKLSDITNESEKYPSKDYNPEDYFRDDLMFLGKRNDDSLIYIPWQMFYTNGQQTIGPSQRGKGVIFQIQAVQLIKRGDFVAYIAPKDEPFMEQILWNHARQYNRPFYLLDLSDDGPGYWHPFTEGTREEQEECLIAGLNLGDAGDPKSNHYRQEDLAAIFESNPPSFRIDDLLTSLSRSHPDNKTRAVYRELTMWARIRSLAYGSDTESFSIDKALLEGAVVYVRSSLSNERIIKATVSFMRLLRLRCAALQHQRKSHATMFVDEASVLVSEELRLTPAASLSGGLNVCIAYQSYLDLTKGLGLEGRAFITSLNNNCQIKLIYGTVDPETKKWAAGMSGQTTKSIVTQERTVINSAGGEAWDDGRLVTTMQVNFLEENTIQSFSPRVGALILPGGKPAEIIFTSYLSADRGAYDLWLDSETNSHKKRLAEIENDLASKSNTSQGTGGVPPAFP